MAINQYKALLVSPRNAGFALLVAVVFVSVMLAFGTALGALGYKQQVLAANGARSQYAFYAADAALECALTDAQRVSTGDPFLYTNQGSGRTPRCGEVGGESAFEELCYNHATNCPSQRVTRQKFPIAFPNPITAEPGTATLCAEITVYETSGKPPGSTYLFSQGFDVSCTEVAAFQAGNGNKRIVTQGLSTHF